MHHLMRRNAMKVRRCRCQSRAGVHGNRGGRFSSVNVSMTFTEHVRGVSLWRVRRQERWPMFEAQIGDFVSIEKATDGCFAQGVLVKKWPDGAVKIVCEVTGPLEGRVITGVVPDNQLRTSTLYDFVLPLRQALYQ